jgi:hypothetical protein
MRRKGLSEFVESPQARRLSRRKFLTRLGLGSFALTVGTFFTSIGAYIETGELVEGPLPKGEDLKWG